MYNAKKKKSVFARLITLMMAVLTMALCLSFVPMSASAAEAPAAVVDTAAVIEELPSAVADADFITLEAPINTASITAPKIYTLSDTTTTAAYSDDASYKTVINFFIKWLRRIGALVALVGGIMFSLAIKDNNADQKQSGLMTMVAGFVAVAICTGADMFDLFS